MTTHHPAAAQAQEASNRCKLTECLGKPRCRTCLALDAAYSPAQEAEMRTAFNAWCPYRGSPDPWVVWQAAWAAAMRSSSQAHQEAEHPDITDLKPKTPEEHRQWREDAARDLGRGQAAPAGQEPYGHTNHFSFAGLPLTDGEKRLGSMLVLALGPKHPAIDDFVAVLFARHASPQPTSAAGQPLNEAWLPISSAPKDGTSVLLWTARGVIEGYFEYGSWEQQVCSASYDMAHAYIECKPTHWMPLPSAPKESA